MIQDSFNIFKSFITCHAMTVIFVVVFLESFLITTKFAQNIVLMGFFMDCHFDLLNFLAYHDKLWR